MQFTIPKPLHFCLAASLALPLRRLRTWSSARGVLGPFARHRQEGEGRRGLRVPTDGRLRRWSRGEQTGWSHELLAVDAWNDVDVEWAPRLPLPPSIAPRTWNC